MPRNDDEYDDDDDKPARRSRNRNRDREDYDDDDRPRGRDSKGRSTDLGPLDKMYRDTNLVVLILFGFCCGFIALILSIICLVTAKDEKAKSNALICTIIAAVMTVAGTAVRFSGVLR